MEYIEFDCSPTNENCVQLDKNTDYMPAMRAEANRMIELLNKRFPQFDGQFYKGRCEHEFGPYLEIRFRYDNDDEMCFVEKHYPQTWDDCEPVLMPVEA